MISFLLYVVCDQVSFLEKLRFSYYKYLMAQVMFIFVSNKVSENGTILDGNYWVKKLEACKFHQLSNSCITPVTYQTIQLAGFRILIYNKSFTFQRNLTKFWHKFWLISLCLVVKFSVYYKPGVLQVIHAYSSKFYAFLFLFKLILWQVWTLESKYIETWNAYSCHLR